MALSEQFMDDVHPIDVVEHMAEYYDWEFDRVGEDQIAVSVEGQWRTYSVTLAWSSFDETLRLVCTFELEPPADRLPALYEVLNLVNDQCWVGNFSYWNDHKLMVYRYGLMQSGGQMTTSEQVSAMIETAISSAEQFYPAIQLAIWGDKSPTAAMQVAIAEAYGHA